MMLVWLLTTLIKKQKKQKNPKAQGGDLMSTKPRARTQNQVLALSIMLFSFNWIASFIHYSLSLSGQLK